LLAGLLFTNRTLGLNQQGQITDRFTKATDQLGSDKLDIRLGGIYSLERIARDSKPDQGPVMEVLTAFVRDHAEGAPTATASPGGSSTTTTATSKAPTDVQAVIIVIGRRKVTNDPAGYFPVLDDSNLTWAYLAGVNLAGASLERANLEGTRFPNANLTGAFLARANLTGAYLAGVNLTGVNLTGADLTGADLTDADLTGALNLTQDQVNSAFTNETTKLPPGRNPSPRKLPSQ
jgi:hypothetical protein